jgi:hypothetical protein
LEVLASKIEEYKSEEDLIKTAILKAEKVAEQIKTEAGEKVKASLLDSEAKAKATIDNANAQADQILTETKDKVAQLNEEIVASKEKAEKIIAEAREYASKVIQQKNDEGNQIIAQAENKANEAIKSAKVVSQDILNQAKSISDDIIAKSKEQKEAYDLLIASVKNDAKGFIENVKSLYNAQLEKLEGANLETNADSQQNDESLASIQAEMKSLVSEIDEVEQSIPESINIDKIEQQPAEENDNLDFEEIVDDEPATEETEDMEQADSVFELEEEEIAQPVEEDEVEQETQNEAEFEIEEEPEEEESDVDPLDAVKAFSQNEITPIDSSTPYIPEIDDDDIPLETPDEKSLFDDENPLEFENYFNVKREQDHTDRTQTISLVPPEDEEDDADEPKFKGFFKKKK